MPRLFLFPALLAVVSLTACGPSAPVREVEAKQNSEPSAAPTIPGYPTYRGPEIVPNGTAKRLKIAADFASQPGAPLSTPKGPVMVRRVLIGKSDYVVFTDVKSNTANEVAIAMNGTGLCTIPSRGIIEPIFRGLFVVGWAMPC